MCILCCITTADAAAVTSRTQRRSSAASRMPTMTQQIQSATTATTAPGDTDDTVLDDGDYTEPADTDTVDTDVESEPTEYIIEDKTSQFDDVISDVSTSVNDSSTSSLADKIRAQRAALDAADASNTANKKMQQALVSGQNACDANLRACMMEKCGKDFSKCAGDTDTLWGTKLDACRRDLPCSGHEYTLFTAEIKADRDMNARISSYNKIVECGNSYNDCIINACGPTFSKCLGKKAGDKAISDCGKIAKSCTEQDSGLASRAMNVFGVLRQDAEKQIAADEKRLYELRDLMRDTCDRLGAMFDERTLDCVYTVNFYAGDKNTLYASKKAYAGSTFNCDQNWFGVDITTFKENAFRLTREQQSASSALMGSGIGMGVGAITSGAIDRAIDRHKAEQAAKKAEKEHKEMYGDENSDEDDDATETKEKNNNDDKDAKDDKDDKDAKDNKDTKGKKDTKDTNKKKSKKDKKQEETQKATSEKLKKIDTSDLDKKVQDNKDKTSKELNSKLSGEIETYKNPTPIKADTSVSNAVTKIDASSITVPSGGSSGGSSSGSDSGSSSGGSGGGSSGGSGGGSGGGSSGGSNSGSTSK